MTRPNHIPYFTFYPSDFMNGVRGLTAQEVGVYTMLLCRIYEENGPIEYNELRLATYCGMRRTTFIKTLQKLLDLDKIYKGNGTISNRRADLEISKRAETLKNNSTAGKASAEKRKQKQSAEATTVERRFNHTDTDTDTDTDTKSECVAAASPKTKRASRLPEDWALPKDWGDWALSEGFAASQIKGQADRFRDYWVAKAGPNSVKHDWVGTWRNWMRNSHEKPQQTTKESGIAGNSKSKQRVAAFLSGAQ